MRRACLAVVLAGCAASGAAGDRPLDPIAERHATHAAASQVRVPQLARPAMVEYHMHRYLDDLQAIDRLLVRGKLADARTLAFLVARPAADPGMTPWHREAAALSESALALARAESVDEACRGAGRVAAACAHCHASTFRTPPLRVSSVVQSSPALRHRAALDRLSEALIAATDPPWRSALEAIADPAAPVVPGDPRASRLQAIARDALETGHRDAIDERARVMGELLIACSACHRGGP